MSNNFDESGRNEMLRSEIVAPKHIPAAAKFTKLKTFLLVFTCVIFMLLLQFINNLGEMDPANAAGWVWDYSMGFIKRGFLGQVTNFLFGQSSKDYFFIRTEAIFICWLCYFIFGLLGAWTVAVNKSFAAVSVVFAGALLAPGLSAFAADIGRLDQINFLLFAVTALLISCNKLIPALVITALLSSIAIFTHEAFLILHFPTLACLILFRFYNERKNHRYGLVVGMTGLWLVVVISCIMLLFFGNVPVGRVEWANHWMEKVKFLIDRVNATEVAPNNLEILEASIFDLHFFSMAQNVRMTLFYVSAKIVLIASFTLVSISILFFHLWFFVILKNNSKYKPLGVCLFLCCLSPAAMALLGIDYMRWNQILFINMLISSMFILWHLPACAEKFRIADGLGGIGYFNGSRFWYNLILIISAIFLLFPQSTGISQIRRFPDGFACTFGTQALAVTMPRHPELCIAARMRDIK